MDIDTRNLRRIASNIFQIVDRFTVRGGGSMGKVQRYPWVVGGFGMEWNGVE